MAELMHTIRNKEEWTNMWSQTSINGLAAEEEERNHFWIYRR